MYNRKEVKWKHKDTISIYNQPVRTNEEKGIIKRSDEPVSRRKYSEMNEKEQKESDKRRVKYYTKKVHYLADLAIHNNLNVFVTLTFAECVTDYERAKKEWELFLKRMRYAVGDDIKYIATYELQKRGAYHFHLLTNKVDVSATTWASIWKHGFVRVEKIAKNSLRDENTQINYTFKYVVKDVVEKEGKGKRSKQRKVYCSRNLDKPAEIRTLSDESVEDTIFAYMENIAKTYKYDMCNYQGTKINEVDVIEIKKEEENE